MPPTCPPRLYLKTCCLASSKILSGILKDIVWHTQRYCLTAPVKAADSPCYIAKQPLSEGQTGAVCNLNRGCLKVKQGLFAATVVLFLRVCEVAASVDAQPLWFLVRHFNIETERAETVVTANHGTHGVLHPSVIVIVRPVRGNASLCEEVALASGQ